MRNLTIEIASVPDMEYLVAEIWDGDRMLAEISQENGLKIQFFDSEGGMVFDLAQLLHIMNDAKLLLEE